MNDPVQIQEAVRQTFAASGVSLGPDSAAAQFAAYLSLLQRWNMRFNLSAIREPEQIIERHFVECAFVAQHLPAGTETLLDYGSGAGFPGIPIAICRPDLRITLAEAQAKKVSFLREAIRVTGVDCKVFDGRVESMPAGSGFDSVTMRAVEKMDRAVSIAAARTNKSLVLMTTEQSAASLQAEAAELKWSEPIRLPNTRQGILLVGVRTK